MSLKLGEERENERGEEAEILVIPLLQCALLALVRAQRGQSPARSNCCMICHP